MDMERKGVQSYQSQLYVRFLCFGNGALTALHDRSDGFFRRQRENISVVVREANNIVDFLSSAGYVQFKADSEAATRDLNAAYKVWCEDNAENPLSPKSFSGFIAQSADAYRLEATNNVYIGSGKRCRGYLGIEVLIKPTAL